jgi:hypothetical protein
VTGGKLLVSDEEQVPALGDGEEQQESISHYSEQAPQAAADGE